MATSLLKIDQPKKIWDRIRKHFTRYVPADIPDEYQHFCDYLERLACREDVIVSQEGVQLAVVFMLLCTGSLCPLNLIFHRF